MVRVADGVTDKKSARCVKPLPGGTVLWAWDADPDFGEAAGEQWLTLLPKKWNPSTHKQVLTCGVTIRVSLEPRRRPRQTLGARMRAVLSMMRECEFCFLEHITVTYLGPWTCTEGTKHIVMLPNIITCRVCSV